jgi:hypothetical protein
MNEVLAIGLVAAFFVAFGFLSKGKGGVSCHASCEHDAGSDACATCVIAAHDPGPGYTRTNDKKNTH